MKTILAVDDSFTIREYISYSLKEYGYNVELASDGLIALEKIEESKKINYSDKKYQTQFADTILTFIPKSEKDKYFTEDNDGNLKAKTAIINADVTIQSLIKNSLEDVTLINTFKVTGNNKNKIDLNANKRFDLAKSHVEDYGSWMSEDKLMNSKCFNAMKLITILAFSLILFSCSDIMFLC